MPQYKRATKMITNFYSQVSIDLAVHIYNVIQMHKQFQVETKALLPRYR